MIFNDWEQQKSSALARDEWEAKVNQNLPDIDALKHTPLAFFFKKRRVGERLQANFAVDVERLSITLAISKPRLEAAVDQGSVKAEGRSIPVNELELELK